uniref:Uncharacterized protein n=1 Tax=Peronospora matthiolae TaxID=2874970 RepID=A0AAV1UJ03_9STRA
MSFDNGNNRDKAADLTPEKEQNQDVVIKTGWDSTIDQNVATCIAFERSNTVVMASITEHRCI